MIPFLIRRIVQSAVVVVGVLIITFILIHLLPGSPARAALGPQATPAAIAHFNQVNGFNLPLPEQFLDYVNRVAHGNLGYSYTNDQTVASLIANRLPKDLVLIVFSTALALALGVPLGIYQAVKRNSLGDYTLTGVAFILYSMPTFFLAFLLLAAFAVQFHILPPEAPQAIGVVGILSHPAGLVLPVVSLALVSFAAFSRYMRSSAMDNLVQDYIRTARAKGLSEWTVLVRHLLRNSLIPIVTLLGLSLPAIVAGAIVVEEVFNYPGMGLLFFDAALKQDYPVLMGFALFVGVATVVGNLLADVVYAALDPRIRYD